MNWVKTQADVPESKPAGVINVIGNCVRLHFYDYCPSYRR